MYLQTGLELSVVNSVEMLINQLAEHKIDAYSQGLAINLQELQSEKLNEQLALFRSQTETEREQDQLLRRYKELIEDV